MNKQVYKRPQPRQRSKILEELKTYIQWKKIDKLMQKLIETDKEISKVTITFGWELEGYE